MRKTALLGAATLALLSGACTESLVVDATGEPVPKEAVFVSLVGGEDGVVSPGEDLRGTVLHVETSTTTNRFVFLDDNVFQIEDPSGSVVVEGTYTVDGQDICVEWPPRGAECWPRLMTVSATPEIYTSNRGQAIRASLLDS